MSLDEEKWRKFDEKYSKVSECTRKSASMKDALPCYEYLYKLKDTIPKELYAFYFRKLLQMNTNNVSKELRLKMFENVNRNDIMYEEELDFIDKQFDDYITVYRGASKEEIEPGLSWTIYKYVAEETYYNGKLFKAIIPKSSILLYFKKHEAEGEIIANVTSGYEVIK